jgi:hypothetical protein
MTKLNEYVKIAKAAKMLGISQNTLRAWAESGKFRMHRNPAKGCAAPWMTGQPWPRSFLWINTLPSPDRRTDLSWKSSSCRKPADILTFS